jgi:hypothetical protein
MPPGPTGDTLGHMASDGVEVRGLLVNRASEFRRIPWSRDALDLLMGVDPDSLDDWTVVTVSAGTGRLVAHRRFENPDLAGRASMRFVRTVSGLTESEYQSADWQALLDRS